MGAGAALAKYKKKHFLGFSGTLAKANRIFPYLLIRLKSAPANSTNLHLKVEAI